MALTLGGTQSGRFTGKPIPLVKVVTINDVWSIRKTETTTSPVYWLITIPEDGIGACEIPIDTPIVIELFEQLITARQVQNEIAHAIAPYIQSRKEWQLTRLLDGKKPLKTDL